MASGHREHGMGMGSHILEKLLKDREVTHNLFQEHEINKEYDLPYLGGYSVDGKTVYLDRHLPDRIGFEVDGKKYDFNPVPYIRAHETFEKAVMDALGWSYPAAHEAATGYERRHVLASGLPWQGYQNSLKPFIKADEHEALTKVPADLDMKPYLTHPVDESLIARMEKAMVGGKGPDKHSKQDVNYSEGKPTSHCGPVTKWPKGDCKHFEAPSSCQLVRGHIKATGWCGLFKGAKDGT